MPFFGKNVMTHSKHLLSVNMLTFHFNKIYGSEGGKKIPTVRKKAVGICVSKMNNGLSDH